MDLPAELDGLDLSRLNAIERDELETLLKVYPYRWSLNSRPEQRQPSGDYWDIWAIVTGRGWGKTRVGSETVREWTKQYPIINLVAPTASDLRMTMIEGESGILACSPPWDYPKYEPSKLRITWPNGAQANLFSAEEPDRLRGPQCYAYWCDELAAWKHLEATWDNLQFGARLGKHVRGIITTTPRPVKVLKDILADSRTVVTRGSTYANKANLSATFLRRIEARYAGTRLGRQEIEGFILEDNPLALWRRAWIEAARIRELPTEWMRIVVGVDPQAAEDGDGAETGIVVAGQAWDKRFVVLEDLSIWGTPAEWAAQVKAAYDKWQADVIVAEANNGGAMVRHTIESARVNLPVKLVYASRGKRTRAEPISALYEQGRVSHYGAFPALEDQQCEWTPGDRSPDRMDALVWALTELSGGGEITLFAGMDVRPA